ncbi:MAG: response regulator [Oligoflexales bacterium]
MVKILIVDDQKELSEAIEAVLQAELSNIKTFLGNDGKSGWELFQEINPDLVITDYKMPVWSGADLAREIRQQNNTLPIILITEFADNFNMKLFTDLLFKPLELSNFLTS